MNAGRLILWAAPPQDAVGEGGLRFFPSEHDASARLRPEQVRALLEAPSALYEALTAEASRRLAARSGVPAEALAVLLREPLVLLTHLWLDRLVRMDGFVRRHGAGGLAVSGRPEDGLERDLDKTRQAAAGSQRFNQGLIARVASVWGIPDGADAPPTRPAPAPAKKPAANLNFDAPALPRRALWKLNRALSRRFGRVPTLGLAYAEWCFLDAGLVGAGRLADLHGRLSPLGAAPDEALRAEILAGAADACAAPFLGLLEELGLGDDAVRAKARTAYSSWLADAFPSALLEERPVHLAAALERLRPYAGRPLVYSQTGDLHTAYHLCAATALGMERIGLQHAAHYGFTLTPTFTEMEFPHFDRFVTWGWDRPLPHPQCRRVRTEVLPSPWLSERAARWRSLRRAAPPVHDVVLMTDKLQRFPPSLNTNRHSRLDFLPELTETWRGAVLGLTGAGVSVLHKPFDDASLEVVSGLVARLRREGGSLYRLHDALDKGLTRELLQACGMVVWDEPGTGPFECWTSGIPSLLLWTRACSREVPGAREDFLRLERAGLLHREPATLVREVLAYRKDPAAWMSDPARVSALRDVCARYARTAEDWAARWRAWIDGL